MASALQDAEIGQRGYLLTSPPAYVEMVAAAERRAPRLLERLRDLTRDNARQQRNLLGLQALIAERRAQIDRAVTLAPEGRRDQDLADVRAGTGLRTMTAYRIMPAKVLGEEDRLLAERSLSAARNG